jgi:very-short-patch-repair endonuclease
MSMGEEAMALHLRAEKILVVREYKFHNIRKWKFDFAIPSKLLAIEVEGGTWSGSRHTSGEGYLADCRKYSEAAVMGWRVIRATTEMVMSGEAIELVLRALA